MRYPRAMHNWHGIAVWLGILFVIVPALAGGVLGFVLYRRKLGRGGASLQGVISGAIIGAAAGAGIAALLLRY
jgi:outer membrane lipoprotein SlyB